MRRIDVIGMVALAFALGAAVTVFVNHAPVEPPLSTEQRTAIELIKVCSSDIAIEMFAKQRTSMTLITCNVPLPDPEPLYKPTRTVNHHE